MGKYVIMQDMRRMPSYRNINARLVYMHVAMGCDVSTYRYETSYRRLALDLDMTLETVRSALRALIRDGLVATYTTTQWTAQGTTRPTTQRTTHLCIVIMRQNGTPNGTPNNTPDNTPDNTGNNTAINNYNIPKEEKLPPTYAREHAEELAAMAAEVLRLARQEADFLLGEFLKRKEIEQKTWTDEGDLKAHFLSWCEKNLKTLPKRRKNSQSDDHAARMDEYAATEERKQEQTEQEKDEETWGRMMRFAAECAAKRDDRRMVDFLASADELCEKWGWKKITVEEYQQQLKESRKRK